MNPITVELTEAEASAIQLEIQWESKPALRSATKKIVAARDAAPAPQYDAAREIFAGDWDENGTVSVHLPTDLAEKLILSRGWRKGHGAWAGTYISPRDINYDLAGALQIALVAEVV